MKLELLAPDFTVCKVPDFSRTDPDIPFTFLACTDEEKSVVCPSEEVPDNALVQEPGWKAFRVQGPLDFSLVGILAKIAGVLQEAGISLFALSTYDTDYILVKQDCIQKAVRALTEAGYEIESRDLPD